MDQPELPRRSFLKWAIHGLGALFAVVLGVPAAAYIIDPRNRPNAEKDFRTADGIRVSQLRPGIPEQGVLRDVRTDAWTLYPDDVVGRIWVVKDTRDEIHVFTTTCPHLGCSINLSASEFACPCHGARFDLNGAILEDGHQNPAPRPMDTLDWRLHPQDHDLIQVKYQRFYQGREDKKPVV